MKNNTVIGIFETAAEAKQAVQQLTSAGFELDYVDVSQASASASGTSSNYANTSGTATEAVGDAAGGRLVSGRERRHGTAPTRIAHSARPERRRAGFPGEAGPRLHCLRPSAAQRRRAIIQAATTQQSAD